MHNSGSTLHANRLPAMAWYAIAGILLLATTSAFGAPVDKPVDKQTEKSAAEQSTPPKEVQALAQSIEKGIPLKCRHRFRGHEAYRFAGNRWSIVVDAESARVAWARYEVPGDKRKAVAKDRAVGLQRSEARLVKWLATHHIDLKDWALRDTEQVDLGEAGVGYRFQWVKRSPEGVYLPAYVRATLAGDGVVEQVDWVDYPVTIALAPKLARPDAMAKAIAACGMKNSRISSVRLQVWYYPTADWRSQVLRYEVDMCGMPGSGERGANESRTVYLDANTGEVLSMAGPIWR